MSNSNSIPLPTDPRFKNLTGKVFTRLTVLGYAGKPSGHHKWHTVCECGREQEAQGSNLTSGHTRSCGCLSAEVASARAHTMHRTKHNMTHSPEYRAWDGMWRRCTNPKHKSYHLYKDRAPPEEWRDFSVFYAEIGPKPAPGYSVDRIDNDKPYGPGNVRWTTDHVQARNKTTNIWTLTPDGQRLILTDSCRLLGLDYEKVKFRRWMGESIEDASNGLLKAA